MPARSIFWRLVNSGIPGDIQEAVGTDQLITVTGLDAGSAIQINIGDGNWRNYSTLPGEVPETIRAGTLQNPSLCMSLGPLRQEGPRPFVNQFKLGEPWRAGITGGGTRENAQLVADGVVTIGGAVNSVPAGLDNVGVQLLMGLRPNMGGGTRWRLMWTGTGTIQMNGAQNVINQDVPNQIDFDMTPNGSNFVFALVTSVTAGPLDNWRLINHDDLPQYNAGKVFRDQFVEEIRNYRALRFDNWVDIVQNRTSSWTNRALPTDNFWAHDTRRIPLEVCVDLCNLIGADMWLCLPYTVTNDFISQCAIMVRDRLNTNRHCYIEYAHKCWDFATPAAQYCRDQGNLMFGVTGNPGVDGQNFMEWYGVQSGNVARLWRAAWGATSRLRPVLQTQGDWLGLESAALNAPRWVAQAAGRRAPKFEISAYGVHAQIDGSMAYGERYAMIEGWRTTLTETEVFNRLRDQSLTGAYAANTGRTVQNQISRWNYHRGVANENGHELVCVDAGSHLHAGGEAMGNQAHLDMLSRYHWSPQFATVAQAILDGWESADGDLLSWSVHSRIPESTINVGLQRWEGDHNLIWDVVYGWNASHPGPIGRGMDFVGPFDMIDGSTPPVDPDPDPVDPDPEPGTAGPTMTAVATNEPLGFAGHSSVMEIFDGGNFDQMWAGTIRQNIIGGDTHSDDLWNANGPERNNPVGMLMISEMDESPIGRYADPTSTRGRTNLQYHYYYGMTAANQNAEMILFWHPTPRHSYDESFAYNRSVMNYYRQWLSDKIGQTVWVMPADLYVTLLRQGGMSDTQIWRDDYHLADNVGGVGPKTGLGFMLYRMLTGQVPAVTAGNQVYHDAAMAALAQYRWGGTGGTGNDQVFSVASDPLPSPLPLPGGGGTNPDLPGTADRILELRATGYTGPAQVNSETPVVSGNVLQFTGNGVKTNGANMTAGGYIIGRIRFPVAPTEMKVALFFGGDANNFGGDPYCALELGPDGTRVVRYGPDGDVWAVTNVADYTIWHTFEMWQFGTTLGISVDGVDATATVAAPGNCPGIAILDLGGQDAEGVFFQARRTMPTTQERAALRDLAASLSA